MAEAELALCTGVKNTFNVKW